MDLLEQIPATLDPAKLDSVTDVVVGRSRVWHIPGVGVPPPTPTWGTMLADNLDRFITDPRLVMLPGLAITITVLAFNLLGDSLRDAMDPRSWGAR